jgi:glycosyltransferase involved in cell wall biosynthesis
MTLRLIVNSSALRSSLGVQRLYDHILPHLHWPSPIEVTRGSSIGAIARVQELLRRGSKDAIFWSPTHRGPLLAHHHVVSVHDCINIEYTYRHDWRLPAYRRLFNAVLKAAEAVVALSQATRHAILANYSVDEAKIVVIPAGFDPPALAAAAPTNPAAPFVLMVTNALPHKNTLNACEALAKSNAPRAGVTLRVVGSVAPQALELMARAGLKFEIHRRVDDETLAEWYRGCLFLFSATLAEGYNLPVAEAIASSANVLCSDIPVHREFFSSHAAFFDPTRIEAMVAALNAGLTRTGRWYPFDRAAPHRTFIDMAADYRAVFERISQRAAQIKL